MSIIKAEDKNKWINAFIAIVSIIIGYVSIRFILQLGEWFDLEAKIRHFLVISQITGIIVGLVTFIIIIKNKNAVQYLYEVYGELLKVIWPDKDDTIKVTIGMIIGISIISGIFVLVDFIFRKILGLIY